MTLENLQNLERIGQLKSHMEQCIAEARVLLRDVEARFGEQRPELV